MLKNKEEMLWFVKDRAICQLIINYCNEHYEGCDCQDCLKKLVKFKEFLLRYDQPERSKREDSQVCEMRCSEL